MQSEGHEYALLNTTPTAHALLVSSLIFQPWLHSALLNCFGFHYLNLQAYGKVTACHLML